MESVFITIKQLVMSLNRKNPVLSAIKKAVSLADTAFLMLEWRDRTISQKFMVRCGCRL